MVEKKNEVVRCRHCGGSTSMVNFNRISKQITKTLCPHCGGKGYNIIKKEENKKDGS